MLCLSNAAILPSITFFKWSLSPWLEKGWRAGENYFGWYESVPEHVISSVLKKKEIMWMWWVSREEWEEWEGHNLSMRLKLCDCDKNVESTLQSVVSDKSNNPEAVGKAVTYPFNPQDLGEFEKAIGEIHEGNLGKAFSLSLSLCLFVNSSIIRYDALHFVSQ